MASGLGYGDLSIDDQWYRLVSTEPWAEPLLYSNRDRWSLGMLENLRKYVVTGWEREQTSLNNN